MTACTVEVRSRVIALLAENAQHPDVLAAVVQAIEEWAIHRYGDSEEVRALMFTRIRLDGLVEKRARETPK